MTDNFIMFKIPQHLKNVLSLQTTIYPSSFESPCKRTINVTRFVFNKERDMAELNNIHLLCGNKGIFTRAKAGQTDEAGS